MFEFRENAFEFILATYNRTEESFEEDVATVKRWLQNQPHLPEIMDDKRIRNFLLINKCSVEKAKQKIDNYYTVRTLIPELYRDVDDPEVLKTREIGYWVILPKMTEDMCRVHIVKLRRKNLINQLEPSIYYCLSLQLMEIRLKEDCMFTDIIIFDLKGRNWEYLLKLTPTFLSKVYAVLNKVFSTRLKAIHVFNTMPGVDQVLSIAKAVMKPKLLQRIHVYKNSDSIKELLPKEILPKDYGGHEKSMEELYELQSKKLNEYKNWIHAINRMKVDENLRPEKLNNDEFLGFHGNFKKLDVD